MHKETSRRTRARTIVFAAAIGTAAALIGAGCGGSATDSGGGSGTGTAGASGKKAKVAYVDGSCTNSWRIQVRAEFEAAAKANPNISSAKYICAQGDLNQAISGIQTAAAQGYSPIVVFSDFGNALLPAIRAAHKKGAVVVPWLVDVGGTPGKDYTAFVHDDLTVLGTATADFLAKKMDKKGNLIAVEGPAGNAYDKDLNAAIAKRLMEVAPNIKWLDTAYADWDPAKSAQAASALLSKHKSVQGLITDEGSTVPGIISRWQATGRPLPVMYSNDLNSNMKLYMRLKPKNPTLAYGFRSGRTYGSAVALAAAMKAFEGKTLTEQDTLVQSPSYDCDTVCAKFYKPSMPGSYIPTSKVPADQLKPLLKGN
jgi:ribose transport system substrate-binding protein